MTQDELKLVLEALPCCGYADASAVKWNPHNQVVQCHNCGQVYTHPQRTWVGLNKEEAFELQVKHKGNPFSLSAAVENLLREKNQ